MALSGTIRWHFRELLSSLLWVSVSVKLDMCHWTACHCRATKQTWWTCLRQGPEREFNVRRQRREEPVLFHSGAADGNRYATSRKNSNYTSSPPLGHPIFFLCYLIKKHLMMILYLVRNFSVLF